MNNCPDCKYCNKLLDEFHRLAFGDYCSSECANRDIGRCEERERAKRIASQLKFSKEDDSYDAGWNNALDTVINDVDGCSEDYKSKELGVKP